MTDKRALITGIAGQDGVYLSRLLLNKGYRVFGLLRRADANARAQLLKIIDHEAADDCVTLVFGDLTDNGGVAGILSEIRPDEIYNLGAQSQVASSYRTPELTANVNGIGPLRLLEAARIVGIETTTHFFQASTSDLFGETDRECVDERQPFEPNNPYATAKLLGHWFTVNFREAYGARASNGILFNHESPLRSEAFVTRKITKGVARMETGDSTPIVLGNLDSARDWSHAEDIVEGIWRIAQQQTGDDYILASGVSRTVRQLVETAFAAVDRNIVWRGAAEEEAGLDPKTGAELVRIDPEFFRPVGSTGPAGDAKKARERLGWRPAISFERLVEQMVQNDLAQFKNL